MLTNEKKQPFSSLTVEPKGWKVRPCRRFAFRPYFALLNNVIPSHILRVLLR